MTVPANNRPCSIGAECPAMRKGQEQDDASLPDLASAHVLPADAEFPLRKSAPSLRFDWMDWLPYLEDDDIPEERKRELIEALWSIVVAFVDFGWRIDANPETGAALDLKAILDAANTEKEAP